MKRLPKGALVGRITASIVASTIAFSLPLQVTASDLTPSASTDTTVTTLAPLEAAAPSTQQLQFTPAEPTFAPESGDAASANPSSLTAADSHSATAGDAIAPAPPEVTEPQPLAAVDSAKDSSPTGAPASDAKELAQAGGTDAATPEAPKQLAQSRPGAPRTLADPAFRQLPTTVGAPLVLGRAFKKFQSNQIIHNLAFRDTPVKEVVAELARRGNLNIMLDPTVQGNLTGDLHDVTLNEAMDTVLTSVGLEWRQLENSTVIIASPGALVRLGLNRPLMRVFKISYVNAFEVCSLLYASIFNRGTLPDFTTSVRSRHVQRESEIPSTRSSDTVSRSAASAMAGGGTQTSTNQTTTLGGSLSTDETESGNEFQSTVHLEGARSVRGALREQLTEGSGFNSEATDPGSQQIRSVQAAQAEFEVNQNGGGAICMPDSKNRQVIVIGTQEDINLAEEAIRLIDRRPRQIHIQSSLVELDNSGIRELGAALNLQGAGASGTILGGSGAPMINFLPGLGSATNAQVTNTLSNAAGTVLNSITQGVVGINPIAQTFNSGNFSQVRAFANGGTLTPVTTANATSGGFGGILGTALGLVPTIAGVTANTQAQSSFNFLSLSKQAGGRANIATVPAGVNLSLNMVLQTNKGKLLANPSVLVEDNTETLITLANEVIHKVTTTVSLGVVTTNVELVKAGIFLDVIPRCSEDGFISLRLRPSVSTPLGPPQEFANNTVVVTLLNIRDILTQEVRVKDGQTLVIGGLFTEQESATMSKVPYLAEAPILGALFRSTIKGRDRTELMLLITPKIVEEQPTNAISETGPPGIL